MLLFQVDLFPARGARPTSLSEVYSREKDIRYSSRTRLVTDYSLDARREHELVRRVLAKLPQELRADPDVEKLTRTVAERAVNIVHLIYRKADWEDWVRDFEFSRTDMEVHWNAGRDAIAQSMRNNALLARNIASGRTAAFDLTNGKEMEE
jgi:NTE family protein